MIWRRAILGIVLALACLPLSAAKALADWQYTRWGMTRAQVIEASKGQAIAHAVKIRESWGIYPELVAPSRFAKHAFRAYFYFNGENDQLNAVRLVPVGTVWCPDVAKALMTRYGSDHILVDGYFIWRDSPAKNKITLSGFSTCRIKYERLE